MDAKTILWKAIGHQDILVVLNDHKEIAYKYESIFTTEKSGRHHLYKWPNSWNTRAQMPIFKKIFQVILISI